MANFEEKSGKNQENLAKRREVYVEILEDMNKGLFSDVYTRVTNVCDDFLIQPNDIYNIGTMLMTHVTAKYYLYIAGMRAQIHYHYNDEPLSDVDDPFFFNTNFELTLILQEKKYKKIYQIRNHVDDHFIYVRMFDCITNFLSVFLNALIKEDIEETEQKKKNDKPTDVELKELIKMTYGDVIA